MNPSIASQIQNRPLELIQELILRHTTILEDYAQQPNPDFLRRNRDIYRPVGECDVTSLLPDCTEPVVVAEDLDQLLAFYRFELSQCR